MDVGTNLSESSSTKRKGADDAPMFHQNFDNDDVMDRVSGYKSVLSRRSNQQSLILKSVTPSSKSALTRAKKAEGQTKASSHHRFKSNMPHVTLKCAKFDSLEQGWLFKKFDTNSSNKALINGFDQLALFTFDTDKLDFQFRPEMLKQLNDFFSAVTLFGDSKPNLLACSCFSDKSVRLEDLEKFKNVSVIRTGMPAQITTLGARNNLVEAGACDASVSIWDVRSGKRCFARTLPGISEFNPVISVDRSENMLLCSARDSVTLLDLRNIGGQFLVEQRKVSDEAGVNVARFMRDGDELGVALTQIGSKVVRVYDARRGMMTERSLKTKRKILAMAANLKDKELAFLEGSEKLAVTFYSFGDLAGTDQLSVGSDCLDIRFNSTCDSLLTFGTKTCQVYCFENEKLVQMTGTQYNFD